MERLETRLNEHDRLELANKKRQFGCAIRALESATGVMASNDELKMRLAMVEASLSRNDIKLNTPNPDDIPRRIEEAEEADRQGLMALIERFKAHNTPLGKALRQYTAVRQILTPADIGSKSLDKSQVLAMSHNHIAHVIVSDGGFRSKSDNEPVSFFPNSQFEAIVLIPRVSHLM